MLIPRPPILVQAASLAALVISLIVLGALLLFVIWQGGLDYAWNQSQGRIAIYNTTDALLCVNASGARSPECHIQLKPRATSHWGPGPCSSSDSVYIYEPETVHILYDRHTECGGFEGAIIIIKLEDGEFVVTDSLQSE